jgi:hypothetical protein
MCLCLNGNQVWMAEFHAPGSMAHIGFRSPPHLSTFKRKGRVQNQRCISSTDMIGALGSTVLKMILNPPPPPPPRLSTFRRRGGGSGIEGASLQWLQFERLDQWCTGNPGILYPSVFNQHGPLPYRVISHAICSPLGRAMRLTPFSPSSSSDICLPPLSWSLWSLPILSSTHHRPCVLLPYMSSSH